MQNNGSSLSYFYFAGFVFKFNPEAAVCRMLMHFDECKACHLMAPAESLPQSEPLLNDNTTKPRWAGLI